MFAAVLLVVTYVVRTPAVITKVFPPYGEFDVGKIVSLGPITVREVLGPPIPTWAGM